MSTSKAVVPTQWLVRRPSVDEVLEVSTEVEGGGEEDLEALRRDGHRAVEEPRGGRCGGESWWWLGMGGDIKCRRGGGI